MFVNMLLIYVIKYVICILQKYIIDSKIIMKIIYNIFCLLIIYLESEQVCAVSQLGIYRMPFQHHYEFLLIILPGKVCTG